MKRLKKFLSASRLNVAIFVVATALILSAAIGGASAAMSYLAETYASPEASMQEIGVTLLENGNDATPRPKEPDDVTGVLLGNMLEETDGELHLGKAYQEALAVCNTGTIDEFVRVSIYKYWEDAEGHKMTNLRPDYIDLNILTGNNYWFEDTSARTSERTVLYYQRMLPVNWSTPLFCDTLTINSNVAYKVTETVTQEGDYTIYTYTYDYDGARFVVRADVDAIQTHNASDVIRSCWGIEMSQFGIVAAYPPGYTGPEN